MDILTDMPQNSTFLQALVVVGNEEILKFGLIWKTMRMIIAGSLRVLIH